MKNKKIYELPESAQNTVNSLVSEYEEKILDSIIENAVVKNMSVSDISIRDVLEAEAQIESEREIKKDNVIKKKIFNIYLSTTFSFSIILTTLIFQYILNEKIEETINIILLSISSLLLILILTSVIQLMKSLKRKNIRQPLDTIKWSIVKKWADIEKMVSDKIVKDSNNKIVSPIEIIKWIKSQEEIALEARNDINKLLVVRNETVHSINKTNFSINELRKIEDSAIMIINYIGYPTST